MKDIPNGQRALPLHTHMDEKISDSIITDRGLSIKYMDDLPVTKLKDQSNSKRCSSSVHIDHLECLYLKRALTTVLKLIKHGWERESGSLFKDPDTPVLDVMERTRTLIEYVNKCVLEAVYEVHGNHQ